MKYTVVIIDDEKLIARNIAKKVAECGPAFEVIHVSTHSMEALEFIQTNLPNVVITDIRMPEMDGLQLAKILSEKYPFITCIIISGFDDFSFAQQAIRYDVKDYLLKPLDPDKLRSCLDKISTRLDAMSAELRETSEKIGKTSEEIVRLVEEYIHKNYELPINLTSLAESFGFSVSYLTKIFTKYTGFTPARYIKEYRISIAKQMLKTTNLPISIISIKAGFGNQFYFCKTFKNTVGMTPTQYRVG